MAAAGIQGPSLRTRSAGPFATVLDRAGRAELAAEMLGHMSSKITREHYIEHDETVNPMTAEILELLAPS
jgi:hypothetical protein